MTFYKYIRIKYIFENQTINKVIFNKMEEVEIFSFIKFGTEENILDLLENGTIYCNPIETFRQMEDDFLRGDSYEGTIKIINYLNGGQLGLTMPNGKNLQFNTSKAHYRKFYSEIKGNIYCLTAVTEQEIVRVGNLKLDARLSRFGSHFLLVIDNKKFFELLVDTLKDNDLEIETGFVSYYNKEEITDELNFFCKPKEFEYQKEFRIIIQNEKSDPIKIQLGSLRDIAQIFEIKDLDSLEFLSTPE